MHQQPTTPPTRTRPSVLRLHEPNVAVYLIGNRRHQESITMKLTILAILLTGVSAFTIQPRASLPRTSSLRMSEYDDSFPSDSSDDSHFSVEDETTIDVDNKPSSAAEATVSSLMDYLPSSVTSGPITAEDRASINEAILRLEALNPTEDPVYSSELNGVWNLRYAPRDLSNFSLGAVAGGFSPGLLALGLAQKLPAALVELGELEICKCSICLVDDMT